MKLSIGCELISGYAFKSSDFSETGVPVIKIANIKPLSIDTKNCQKINNISDSLKMQKFLVAENDVLIAMTGQGSVGNVGIVRKTINKDIYINQRVGKIICDEININNLFLYYVLSSESYRHLLFELGSGTGQPNLSPNQILSVELPEISYEKQRVIGESLNNLELKIIENCDHIEVLNNTLNNMFQHWFNDYNYPNPTDKIVFNDQLERKIPKNWEVIMSQKFLTPISEKIGETTAQIYSTTNNGMALRDEKFNKNLTKSQGNNKKVVKDDLIFGLSREILNFGVFAEEIGSVSPAYQIFKIDQSIILPFMLELELRINMSRYMDILQLGAREGQGIRKDYLLSKYFLVPKMEIQEEFFKLYDVFQGKIKVLKEENAVLSEIRDTLLPKLMSGELPVKVGEE